MTMLLLIISLYSLQNLFNCVNYEKAKFDEFSLMKQHHQNVLQIKDFIKAAQHKFHEQRSVLRGSDNEHDTTRDGVSPDYSVTNWSWDNTSWIDQLGLNTPQTFFLPLTRSRPSFPFSITSYTTELNNRYLKWEEIFTDQNATTDNETRPYESKLRIVSKVSSPLKNPSLLQPPSITMKPGLKNQKTFGASFQPTKLQKSLRPLHPNTTSTSINTSLRGHSDQLFGPTTTLITPIEEYKKMWLQEITTYAPVDRWFKSTQTGMTPSYNYTIKRSSQVERALTKAQTSVQSRQWKNDSKDQPPLILRQGISLSETPTEIDDYRYPTTSTATAKTAQSFIEDVGGILHLRTTSEKDEERTKMIDEITATVSNDEQHPDTSDTPASPFRKSRRFHSKARARKCHHQSHRQHKVRQKFQKQRYRYPEYSNEDIYQRQQEEVEYRMWRRMRESTDDRKWFSINTPNQRFKTTKKVTRPTENRRPTDPPNVMLQFHSEHYDSEDEELIKFIDRRDESVRKTAQKDKTSLYHQVKESLKKAKSKLQAKRLKLKAELLRKIVEGSSYSDEEASLTKNLIQALQYGNWTEEHNVARSNRDTMKRIIR